MDIGHRTSDIRHQTSDALSPFQKELYNTAAASIPLSFRAEGNGKMIRTAHGDGEEESRNLTPEQYQLRCGEKF